MNLKIIYRYCVSSVFLRYGIGNTVNVVLTICNVQIKRGVWRWSKLQLFFDYHKEANIIGTQDPNIL